MNNEPTIKLKDVLFLPGHTPAEGLVKTYYLSDDGKRIELTPAGKTSPDMSIGHDDSPLSRTMARRAFPKSRAHRH
jgi:hypothetical protein